VDTNLHLDWCDYRAAKYACENWHYSGTISATKGNYIGVWENGEFKGVLIYTCGSGASCNGKKYGLRENFDMSELQRIALREHEHEVSKMISISIKLLKRKNPDLKMLVSYSDPEQGHTGAIYQASNWIYVGRTKPTGQVKLKDGRWVHKRTVAKRWGKYGKARRMMTDKTRKRKGKLKYLYPLTEELKEEVEKLSKPYPKEEDLEKARVV